MTKKILGITLIMMVIGVGSVFALEEIISIEEYERASRISINRANAQELLWRVNTLLKGAGVSSVRINSAARSGGSPTLHPHSRAVDLAWNQNLYNYILRNISGSGLRLECIDCIRASGESSGHIHLDIGGPNGEGLPLGRMFHLPGRNGSGIMCQ